MIESIVVAFVLAFLFRTFEAEAFVIPTGSMAPTLMGRHKDLICDECGQAFQASASDEVDRADRRIPGVNVVHATCPICRHTMEAGPESSKHPSYKGDRILVSKLAYQFGSPKRWDVAVFMCPVDAKTNYIKRLVGLPGETIRIRRGNLYVETAESAEEIARKLPHKVKATLQPIHDTDHTVDPVLKGLWPARWSPGDWSRSEDGLRFEVTAPADRPSWLRYEHRVPSVDDWARTTAGLWNPGETISPQLITDFTAYNSQETRRETRDELDGRQVLEPERGPRGDQLGLHWVGDLAVQCSIRVRKLEGEVFFQLVEGGQVFTAQIDLVSGEATLLIEGTETTSKHATSLAEVGEHEVTFANVDDQLVLWVDGEAVVMTYSALGNNMPVAADLQPARIGARGTSVEIEHVKLFRDIYYIAVKNGQTPRLDYAGSVLSDFPRDVLNMNNFPPILAAYSSDRGGMAPEAVRDFLSNPRQWPVAYSRASEVEFVLEEDQFLALGDNSASSQDSRLWGHRAGLHFVDRDLLIGKAMLIYWPHSLNQIPGTSIPIRFFPNFWRMRLIR